MPSSRPFPFSAISGALAGTFFGLALVLAGAGCSHPVHDELADSVATGEHPVAMSGQGAFFGGQVIATVTVSRGVGHGTHPGGGGSHHHDSNADNGGMAGGDSMDNDQAMAYMRARGALGSPLPPVSLHLKLQNKGPSIVQVEIQEMNSDLGNFAVEPELLSLAPDQTGEPDPMISQLGVTSDEIPVKVTLQVAGKSESQTILVKSLAEPASEQK